MKTEVLMKRDLFGYPVEQKSKSEFLSATGLIKAGNLWRRQNGIPDFNFTAYLSSKGTKEFIQELEKEYGIVIEKGKAKKSKTFVHPLLFVDIALAISPKLKIETYKWLYDNLLKFRNDSGDSYKKMTGALYQRTPDKHLFHRYITRVAKQIQEACGVSCWEEANEAQLKQRDRIHENISLLCNVLNNREEAVRLGLLN